MRRKKVTSRKKVSSGNKAASIVLKRYVLLCGSVLVCAAVILGIWLFGEKQIEETARPKSEESVGEGTAGEAASGKTEERSGKETAEHKTQQSDFAKNCQPEVAVDTVSNIEPQQVLEFLDIQAMAAGDILDVSDLSQEMLDSLFYSEGLSEDVQQRVWNSSYQENNNISLEELRYLRVLHVGFDGETHIGELIVNQGIAEDILEIMSELYKQGYPIEKMVLIDEYGADDESSMSDNNTSAFNYREIAGSSKLSRHALGLAIDINPRYNPYVKGADGGELLVSPANGAAYADRSQEFPYKIAEGDLSLQLFREHGFTWGGSWNSVKDYQHFEK